MLIIHSITQHIEIQFDPLFPYIAREFIIIIYFHRLKTNITCVHLRTDISRDRRITRASFQKIREYTKMKEYPYDITKNRYNTIQFPMNFWFFKRYDSFHDLTEVNLKHSFFSLFSSQYLSFLSKNWFDLVARFYISISVIISPLFLFEFRKFKIFFSHDNKRSIIVAHRNRTYIYFFTVHVYPI